MAEQRLVLLGAGGHARSCIDVIEREARFSIDRILGLPADEGKPLLGYKVTGTDDSLEILVTTVANALVTIGQIHSAEPRKNLFARAKAAGFMLPVIVSPQAYVSPHSSIGEGSIIMPGAVIAAGVIIGRNCIINTRASMDHDAIIGDHCHVSSGAILNGGVTAGDDCFIGSGAILREGIRIGGASFIGMGMRVLDDLPAQSRYTRHG